MKTSHEKSYNEFHVYVITEGNFQVNSLWHFGHVPDSISE
ncbi:hypothetical protein DYY66_1565 [Candidatus Nitrosotalea sp. FS]|nr:hypothetical protein [Candidatus Nitrosotalea sp. FS]